MSTASMGNEKVGVLMNVCLQKPSAGPLLIATVIATVIGGLGH